MVMNWQISQPQPQQQQQQQQQSKYQQEIEEVVGTNHKDSLTMLAAVASEVRSQIRGKRRRIDVEEDNNNNENGNDDNPQIQPQSHRPPKIAQLQFRFQIPQQKNVVNYWVSKFLADSESDTESELRRWVKRRRIEDLEEEGDDGDHDNEEYRQNKMSSE
ncbi:hypothetical protein Glove_23g103 [Diversispora epigaea]|uniref:Uncharacterized protein n=1 Tax=Diversispora epigaea TaxID=1348612 RepID=A0A397JIY9_9GLOM|nr:hypothetical protein Glove_23g103 [Diversispora epigaea]